MNGDEIKLTERLQRGGYVIENIAPGADGTPGAQLGDRWLSLAELHALPAQDSEIENKP